MPTDLNAWSNYVRALVTRYSAANWGYRGIAAYQVWNEANVKNYWTGSPAQMAQLTRITYAAVKARRPRRPGHRPGLRRPDRRADPRDRLLLLLPVPGQPGAGVALHGRHLAEPVPEGVLRHEGRARPRRRCSCWPPRAPRCASRGRAGQQADLEHRDQLRPASPAAPARSSAISDELQAAYVLRTYLLNAANGIKRVHWYAWDKPRPGQHQDVLRQHRRRPRWPARRSTSRSRGCPAARWSVPASRPSRAPRTAAGTYTCVIKYAGGVRRVYWNPTKKVKVTTAKSATYKMGVYGKKSPSRAGRGRRVDYRPLMVRSKL